MKTILIIFVFCLCASTFAQQPNKEAEKLHYSIKLVNYNKSLFPSSLYLKPNLYSQNIESLLPNTFDLIPNLKSQILSLTNTGLFPKNELFISTKNINFTLKESMQLDLSQELRKIMHKFPGDGNNFYIDARGLKN